MSTHTRPTTRQEPPAETTTGPAFGTGTTADVASEASPFDAHDASATFDAGNTHRLPNTIDRGNRYVG